jgi:hypothetical protein
MLCAVFLMMHHPTVSSHGAAMVEEVARKATLNNMVHGGMIALMVVLVFGFLGLARSVGSERPWIRLATVCYAFGALAGSAAAVLNGLVFPEMVARYAGAEAEQAAALDVVLRYGWELNQALAGCMVVSWSAALFACSLVLLRGRGAWRWIGALGVLLGPAAAAALLSGHLDLDVHGFGLFVILQALWHVAAGARLCFKD